MKRGWGVLILLVVCLAAGLSTGSGLLYNLSYLLAATLVVSFLWAWANIHWLELERFTRADRSQVGKTTEERFVLRNTGFLPKLWVEVRDASGLPQHRASRVISSLGPHRQRSWTARTVCRRRGRFTLGPVTLVSGDPFGLFVMRRERPDLIAPMIVYPATVDLPAFAPPVGQLPGGVAMRRRTHYVTTNVSGVRDYAPGDGFNRIHWPSTARTGRLIVKEFELDPTADLWLFLDMEQTVHAGTPWQAFPEEVAPAVLLLDQPPRPELDPTTEEYGVTATASLAKHFIARNRAVGLIAYAYGQSREVVPPDRGERQLNKILETLAVLRAQGAIPLAEVLAAETMHFSRNITVIIVTPSAASDWVVVVHDLLRRGIRVIAVLLEASTFGPAKPVKPALAELIAAGVSTYVVKEGVPLKASLGQPVGEGVDV